jgi:hypothetical protein
MQAPPGGEGDDDDEVAVADRRHDPRRRQLQRRLRFPAATRHFPPLPPPSGTVPWAQPSAFAGAQRGPGR